MDRLNPSFHVCQNFIASLLNIYNKSTSSASTILQLKNVNNMDSKLFLNEVFLKVSYLFIFFEENVVWLKNVLLFNLIY